MSSSEYQKALLELAVQIKKIQDDLGDFPAGDDPLEDAINAITIPSIISEEEIAEAMKEEAKDKTKKWVVIALINVGGYDKPQWRHMTELGFCANPGPKGARIFDTYDEAVAAEEAMKFLFGTQIKNSEVYSVLAFEA